MEQRGLLGALARENPLQIVGTINAYSALQAKEAGFRAIYLSGAGVANASYGLPDLGMTSLDNVLEDVYRITYNCDLPLLVDIDTGFGSFFNIQRTIKSMIKAGANAVHMEDQISAKRCGHRPNKQLVTTEEMCDRIKAAVDAIDDQHFSLMARTDALSVEGLDAALERIHAYIKAGAEMIFLEGATDISQYRHAAKTIEKPLLANITEFGKTPLFTKEMLQDAGVQLILYPLSAFRAMSQAAKLTYSAIREKGTQQSIIDQMQSRSDLYETLHYHQYEKELDDIIGKEQHS